MQYLFKKSNKYFAGKCSVIIIILSGLLMSCQQTNSGSIKAAQKQETSAFNSESTESKQDEEASASNLESPQPTRNKEVSESKNPELIDNVSLLDKGNAYSFDGDKLTLQYETGKISSVVNLPDVNKYYGGAAYTGVYVSDEITAIVYNKNNGTGIMISYDKGKTWNKQTLDQTKEQQDIYLDKKVGFITKDNGWLVLGGDVGAGTQYHYIYETADGGKTWNEIGNANSVYAKMLTGAGFATDNIGFLCFIRIDSSIAPTVYRTGDGGTTWEKQDIPIPEKYLSGPKNITVQIDALSPVFYGANGVLPVEIDLFNGYNQDSAISGLYRTSDYGKTWIYDTSSEKQIDLVPTPD